MHETQIPDTFRPSLGTRGEAVQTGTDRARNSWIGRYRQRVHGGEGSPPPWQREGIMYIMGDRHACMHTHPPTHPPIVWGAVLVRLRPPTSPSDQSTASSLLSSRGETGVGAGSAFQTHSGGFFVERPGFQRSKGSLTEAGRPSPEAAVSGRPSRGETCSVHTELSLLKNRRVGGGGAYLLFYNPQRRGACPGTITAGGQNNKYIGVFETLAGKKDQAQGDSEVITTRPLLAGPPAQTCTKKELNILSMGGKLYEGGRRSWTIVCSLRARGQREEEARGSPTMGDLWLRRTALRPWLKHHFHWGQGRYITIKNILRAYFCTSWVSVRSSN